jgi:hypothetical protein
MRNIAHCLLDVVALGLRVLPLKLYCMRCLLQDEIPGCKSNKVNNSALIAEPNDEAFKGLLESEWDEWVNTDCAHRRR